jgi:hypothetical protein
MPSTSKNEYQVEQGNDQALSTSALEGLYRTRNLHRREQWESSMSSIALSTP